MSTRLLTNSADIERNIARLKAAVGPARQASYYWEGAAMRHIAAGGRMAAADSDMNGLADLLGTPPDAPTMTYRTVQSAATPEPADLTARIRANRAHAPAPMRSTPPPAPAPVAMRVATRATDDNVAPAPPDLRSRILQRGNYAGAKHRATEPDRIEKVKALLRPEGAEPVRDDPSMALPEPLVTAAAAAEHAAPPPPSLVDRIRAKRGIR